MLAALFQKDEIFEVLFLPYRCIDNVLDCKTEPRGKCIKPAQELPMIADGQETGFSETDPIAFELRLEEDKCPALLAKNGKNCRQN